MIPQKEKLIFHGFIKKDDEVNAPNDREFNMLFTYELSAEEQVQIKLQEEEVESADWIPLEKLKTLIAGATDQWRPSIKELTECLDIVLGVN